jgi:V8-like Glu-specific endopeptidase/Ran GTPase-activating protein (RanGAP) involved in mRNA processing and transport
MDRKHTKPLSPEELQRKGDEQILSRIHEGLNNLEVIFEWNKPICRAEKAGANVGSSEYSNESRDLMRRVNNPEDWPFCVHGRFTAQLPDGTLMATGTMIGPELVLTCAYNVFMHEIGEIRKDSMRFYPGMNGRHATYGSIAIKEVYYPEEYKDNINEDYALLVLEKEVGELTGYFRIYEGSKDKLEGRTGNLYGYPADRHDHYLWGTEGFFKIDNRSDKIKHYIDTSSGQGGSSLYIEESGNYYIFGVHARRIGPPILKSREAVFLNGDRIKRIKGWIKDYYKNHRVYKLLDISGMPNAFYQVIREGYLNINTSKLILLKLGQSGINDSRAECLAECNLNSLKMLDLNNNLITEIGARALSCGNFKSLRTLNLYKNSIGAEGARALSQGNLTGLTTLDLGWNSIGVEGARVLSQGNINSLTTLNLAGNNIGAEGARALSQGNLSSLTTLSLAGNSIGAEGARALSQGNFNSLTTLNLAGNNIGPEGARPLSQGNINSLITLDLERNRIGDEGARALSQGNLTGITTLDLGWNSMGVEGARALSQGNLASLTALNLAGNSIGAEGARVLSQGNLSSLTTLNLYNNSIGAEGARALSQGNFTSLTTLDLADNSIGDEEARVLSQGNLTSLKNLYY